MVQGRGGQRLISQYMTAQGAQMSGCYHCEPQLWTRRFTAARLVEGERCYARCIACRAQMLPVLTCGTVSDATRGLASQADATAHDRGVYLRALTVDDIEAGAGAIGLALEHLAERERSATPLLPRALIYDDLRWHAANYTDART